MTGFIISALFHEKLMFSPKKSNDNNLNIKKPIKFQKNLMKMKFIQEIVLENSKYKTRGFRGVYYSYVLARILHNIKHF